MKLSKLFTYFICSVLTISSFDLDARGGGHGGGHRGGGHHGGGGHRGGSARHGGHGHGRTHHRGHGQHHAANRGNRGHRGGYGRGYGYGGGWGGWGGWGAGAWAGWLALGTTLGFVAIASSVAGQRQFYNETTNTYITYDNDADAWYNSSTGEYTQEPFENY